MGDSFNQILVQETQTADLLSLIAVLDRQGIPKALLYRDNNQRVGIITAPGTLQDFSLVSSDKSGEAFEMHRLVHLSKLK